MSSAEIKEALIKKIEATNDESLLSYALELLSQGERVSPFALSAEQKKSIEKGLHEAKEGKVVTDEAFQKELEEWLGKEE